METVLWLAVDDPRSFGERAQALRDARPDLVVVPVADRGGADRLMPLAEPLRFGCAAQRPRVLLASGDDGAIARALPLLGPFALESLGDVRTDEGRRALVARLRSAAGAALARDAALELLARRTAEIQSGSVLVVDVTGSSTSIVRAEAAGPFHALHVRPLGVGPAADRVVARAGLDRVRRWIPWVVDLPTLQERVFNRARWPGAAAVERETAALEIALAHEAIAHAVGDASAAGIAAALHSARAILLTGALGALAEGAAVLVAVDALEPIAPASIALDREGSLVALAVSALASGDHRALDAAIDATAPAAALVPVPTARRTLLRIAAGDAVREERVDRGALFVVDVTGEIDVSGHGVGAARVAAGRIGLVVDARPRPLRLPLRDAERVPTVARWYEALGAMYG